MSSFQQTNIKNKVRLLNLELQLGDVSKACNAMSMSRDTFYLYRNAHWASDVEALIHTNRRKPIPQSRIEQITENAVASFATEQPAYGQVRTCNELRKVGIIVSSLGIQSIWLRHNLDSFNKRLTSLEAMVAKTGAVFTETQVRALEKKAQDDMAHGKIENGDAAFYLDWFKLQARD
jgi:hypothetical protein